MRETLATLEHDDLVRWRRINAGRTVAQSPPPDMTTIDAEMAWIRYWVVAGELLAEHDIEEPLHEVFIDPVSGRITTRD